MKQSTENRTLSPFHARLKRCRRQARLRRCIRHCLRMFRPHAVDQAGLTPCSGSSDPHSAQAREDSEPVFDTEPRVPSIPAKRSHPKNANPNPKQNPAADLPHSVIFSFTPNLFSPSPSEIALIISREYECFLCNGENIEKGLFSHLTLVFGNAIMEHTRKSRIFVCAPASAGPTRAGQSLTPYTAGASPSYR